MATTETMQAGQRLDAAVAEALGWKAYLQTRGEYTLAVTQAPGEREPWKSHRDAEAHRQRYRQVSCAEALVRGFFGRGFPRFSTDMAAAWPVAEKLALSVVHSSDGYYAIKAVDIEHGCVRGTSYPRMSLVGRQAEEWEAFPTAPEAICRAALAAVEYRNV